VCTLCRPQLHDDGSHRRHCGRDAARQVVGHNTGHDGGLGNSHHGDTAVASPPVLNGFFKVSLAFVIGSAVVFAVTVWEVASGYRVNITASLPLGVYYVSPVHGPLRRGDLVTFTLPAPLRLRWWLGSFTKPVGGLAGDRVCIRDGVLLINREPYGPVLPEAPAHALQEGECMTVEEGHIFTASHTPRSYDSRYFGAIALADVQRSIPVVTWSEDGQ
jgi:conjugative transfer signal peptidase TraF